MMYYRRYDVDEETPIQYVGVYVTKWRSEWGEPTAMFARVEGNEGDLLDAAPELLDACKNAEQTLRNLGNGELMGDAATIALNAAKNLYTTIAKAAGKEQE